MSETTQAVADTEAAETAAKAVAVDVVVTKEAVVSAALAAIHAELAKIEAATGQDLLHLRAELDAIGADAEGFFDKMGAWLHKHL
ncbi:MAG TPA: hypothetical protein VMH92_03985 [Acidocella sp.]|nr:hypothetical protein [Acidocella sp.]